MKARLLIAAVVLSSSFSVAAAADLEEGFRNPPDTARLWVYWTCQDGHYSIEGATADLESMKKAGIVVVLRMDCRVGCITYGGTP